jgi:phosphohistidine phosphatase
VNLYFLRHGIAIAHDDARVQSDSERFLTAKGVKRLRKAAKGLRTLTIPFDAILTSPATRARQTADIVATRLAMESQVEEVSELAPESTVDQAIFSLTRFQGVEHVLLVGHEPLLTQTIAFLLTAGNGGLNITLKKAGFCHVEIDRVPPSAPGALHFCLTPKQLRQLGKNASK